MNRFNWFYLAAAIVLAADLAIVLHRASKRKCSRCMRPWAIFRRRTLQVCRSCRDEIDHPPNWHPPARRAA